MNKNFAAIVAALLLVEPVTGTVVAAQPGSTERVQFSQGATSTVIKGKIKGDGDIDYLVRASAGQTLTVTMKTTNAQNYFNINPPGSDVSMFVANTSGNNFKGVLPTDGDYRVRVYLMRPAARRNESSNYTLTISVTGKPLAPVSSSVDAVIPGTNYHASATINCTNSIEKKIGKCEAFVIRRGFDGTATVEVRLTDGFKRRILFVKGKPVSSDSPEKLSTVRKGDINIVSLGTLERFEIPDTLVVGG